MMIKVEELMEHYYGGIYKDRFRASAKNVYLKGTTLFTANEKRLIFIATSHRYGYSAPFHRFFEGIVDFLKPEIVLLEIDYSMTKSQLLAKPMHTQKRLLGERELAIELSNRYGYEVAGMDEPTRGVWRYFVRNVNDGPELFLFITIKNYYDTDRNKTLRGLDKQDIYNLTKSMLINEILIKEGHLHYISRYMPKLRRKYRANSAFDAIDKLMEDIKDRYITKGNLINILSSSKYFDSASASKYKMSKYFVLFHAVRERRMLDTCIKALEKHNNVIAMSGAWHASQLLPVLSKELKKRYGSVGVELWKDVITA